MTHPASSMAGRARDVVFTFSDVDTIDDAVSREFCRPPDQALLALAASSRVGRLVVANPWRSRLSVLRRRRRYDGELGAAVRVVRPFRWRRRDPVGAEALAAAYRAWDKALAPRVGGLDEPVMITFHPFVAAHAPARWASRTVFYARDDWSAYPPMEAWWPDLRRAYELVRARGTKVIAVSGELADRIGAVDTLVLPNGVQESVWTSPRQPGPDVAHLPRPWLTYTGTIDRRLDLSAVLRLARDLPGSVLLAGPTPDDEVRTALAGVPSVHLLGDLDQAALAALVHASDVCLLPHVSSTLTSAMSPLKLFEYLASGRPVVAVDLPPIRAVGEDVQLVGDGDYAGAVRLALARGPLSEAARLAVISRHGWASRHRQMLDFALGSSP